jgi:hypothetical protein
VKHRRASWFLPAALAAGFLGLLWVSIDARDCTDDEESSSSWQGEHEVSPASGADPLTGAVLIDLDDSADGSDRADIASRIIGAIAPVDWTTGDAALGTML